MRHLSGYRIMWVMVMFDLPVFTSTERRKASRFRTDLRDMGFKMLQFSVYWKHVSGKDGVKAICNKIESVVPSTGSVDILQITDKQYETIISYRKATRSESRKNPAQLALF